MTVWQENYALIPTEMHQLWVCSAVCICISIFVYVRGSWNSSQNCFSCSWNKTQTPFCLTLNNFPKSRLFANINVFELFELPKSRLKMHETVETKLKPVSVSLNRMWPNCPNVYVYDLYFTSLKPTL